VQSLLSQLVFPAVMVVVKSTLACLSPSVTFAAT